MNRRVFLAQIIAASLGYVLAIERKAMALGQALQATPPGHVPPPVAGPLGFLGERRLPLMQGMTNENSTQIIVLIPELVKLRYQVLDTVGNNIPLSVQDTVFGDNTRFGVERVMITGLKLGETYTLNAYLPTGELVDSRNFKALDLNKKSPRFVMASCMHCQLYVEQKDMWAEVLAQKPDMVLLLGDNVYADTDDFDPSVQLINERYIETRRILDLFQTQELVPILGMWDDHDFGLDDGNSTFPLKNDILKIYKAFFGSVDTKEYVNGPGVSSILKAFGQRFVFLDDRTWRDPYNARTAINATQWGQEQKNWLYSHLETNSNEPIWLFNGSQFYGRYHGFESVEKEAPAELAELQKRLGALKAPVVLGSGDVHYSEIMNIEKELFGYPTIEITSSAIHSLTDPNDPLKGPNPRRFFAVRHYNFVIVESTPAGVGQLNVQLSIHGAKGAVYHTSQHTIIKPA